jgi:hypothetical protein
MIAQEEGLSSFKAGIDGANPLEQEAAGDICSVYLVPWE